MGETVRPCIHRCYTISIFQVYILDQLEGTAELRLKYPLDCEDKKSFQFDIQALSCTGVYSDR